MPILIRCTRATRQQARQAEIAAACEVAISRDPDETKLRGAIELLAGEEAGRPPIGCAISSLKNCASMLMAGTSNLLEMLYEEVQRIADAVLEKLAGDLIERIDSAEQVLREHREALKQVGRGDVVGDLMAVTLPLREGLAAVEDSPGARLLRATKSDRRRLVPALAHTVDRLGRDYGQRLLSACDAVEVAYRLLLTAPRQTTGGVSVPEWIPRSQAATEVRVAGGTITRWVKRKRVVAESKTRGSWVDRQSVLTYAAKMQSKKAAKQKAATKPGKPKSAPVRKEYICPKCRRTQAVPGPCKADCVEDGNPVMTKVKR